MTVCQQPLFGHQFQIDRLNPSWTSSLSLGVIGHSPDRLNFPSTACCLKRSAWLLQRDSVFHNSLKVNTHTKSGTLELDLIDCLIDRFSFLFHSFPPLLSPSSLLTSLSFQSLFSSDM